MEKCLVQCPHCNRQAHVNAVLIGKKTRCPDCQRIFTLEEYTDPVSESLGNDTVLEGNCPSCGMKVNLTGDMVSSEIQCPYCREKVIIESVKEPEKQCPFCGNMVKKDANICKFCHKNISDFYLKIKFCTGPILFTVASLIILLLVKALIGQLNTKIGLTIFQVQDKIPKWWSGIGYFLCGIVMILLVLFIYKLIRWGSLKLSPKGECIVTAIYLPLYVGLGFVNAVSGLTVFLCLFLTLPHIYLPFLKTLDPRLHQMIMKLFQYRSGSGVANDAYALESNVSSDGGDFEIRCPYCEASLLVSQDLKGQALECPECHQPFSF